MSPLVRFSKSTLLTSFVVWSLAWLATGCGRAQAHEQSLPAPAAFTGVALTDQDGKPLGAAELGGTTLVVSFMFTSCPSVCPTQTRALAEVRRGLSSQIRERVRFLSVSVDPDTDTPEKLREFALRNGAAQGGWSFARGTPESTRALSARLAAFDARGGSAPSAHTTAVYLFDARGNLVQRYAGGPLDVTRLTREIERVAELSRAGNTN